LNAGSGAGFSLNQVVEAISRTTGIAVNPVYKPGRVVDIPRYVLDVSLARESLGWTTKVGFDEALLMTWRWFRQTNGVH
jgi:UDP-glucose 4-epimerase